MHRLDSGIDILMESLKDKLPEKELNEFRLSLFSHSMKIYLDGIQFALDELMPKEEKESLDINSLEMFIK